jgi:hypothetical protein
MNLTQFLEKLKQTPRNWKLQFGYQLRTSGDCDCPISAVIRLDAPNDAERAYLRPIGVGTDMLLLSKHNAVEIVEAADSSAKSYLRERMIEACGLV